MKIKSSKSGKRAAQRPVKKKKSHGFLKFLLAVILLGALIFGGIKLFSGIGDGSAKRPKGPELKPFEGTDPYIDAEMYFDIHLDRLEALLAEKGGDYVPPEDMLERARARMAEYPQYRDQYMLFEKYIHCFDEVALRTLVLSPEKIDYVLKAPVADKLFIEWNGELTTEGDYPPLFIQYDSRWAYKNFGSSYMGDTACGPTSLAMAAVYLTKDGKLNPQYISDFALENSYYVPGSGTMWSFFTEGAEKLGLKGEMIYPGEADMKSRLDRGEVLIASMKPGDFTMAGHYIVIRRYGEDGFYVNDPSSIEKSMIPWTYDKIVPQMAALWTIHL